MRAIETVCFVLFFIIGVVAFSEELIPQRGFYARVDVGYSNARDPELAIPSGPIPADIGSSVVYGGGFGYAYVPGLRGDFTLDYRSGFQQVSGFSAMPKGNADIKSLTALASVYFDVLPYERISPYVGAGLGMSRNDLDTITIKNVDGSLLGTIAGSTKNNFAWQFCVGGAFRLQSNLLIDAGYHYLSAGDYESRDSLTLSDGTIVSAKTRGSVRAHEFLASLQFTF